MYSHWLPLFFSWTGPLLLSLNLKKFWPKKVCRSVLPSGLAPLVFGLEEIVPLACKMKHATLSLVFMDPSLKHHQPNQCIEVTFFGLAMKSCSKEVFACDFATSTTTLLALCTVGSVICAPYLILYLPEGGLIERGAY